MLAHLSLASVISVVDNLVLISPTLTALALTALALTASVLAQQAALDGLNQL